MNNEDLKSYIKGYLTNRKYSYTKLDKHDRAIEVLINENERLLNIAKKMHTWIFLHSGNEQEVYDELGLTDEENKILGYSGQYQFQAYTGKPTLKNIEGNNLLMKEVENEE